MPFEKRELGTPPEFIGSAAGGAKPSKPSGPLKSDFEVVDGLAKYSFKDDSNSYINTIEKQHERAKDFMKWEGRMRYLRTHLIRCYREEGVNHYKYCKPIADRYLKEMKKEPQFLRR
mmetsp:Transcript_10118/g.18428  ORF Transcript_10118/g.18428 Transcript_10118/m.18428 type:complete len:117 (-) Transcript_10118:349-699(-)|eukprot:CAMPEP_0197524508 /NCGR_PEP_ID=MMETSP1318-20131121/9168_1 /TAXON_ID=552666 /ORGANISM="Partenskyella glossopodia, Strain RCC365" /LENGTH=116 /DNA_ID=CAMNT_0043077483 /DNA_START=125 /DNA_END=475 /DNA_ORIENTATION=+